VPVKNGCNSEAPEGGHTTQAGAPLEGAVAAVAEDPREPAPKGDTGPVVPSVAEPLPKPPPLDVAPRTDAVPKLLCAVVPEAGGVATVLVKVAGEPVDRDAPTPSVTTPFSVTALGVVVV
jgi:hypothetical protein